MNLPDFDALLPPRRHDRAARAASADEALRQIPDDSRILVPPMAGCPLGLLEELDRLRDGWSRLELACGNVMSPIAPLDHVGDPFSFITYQTSGVLRAAEQAGHLQHVPATYAQVPTLFRPDGPLPVDVALIQVSPPSADGRYSLGTSVGGVVNAIRESALVIAQVNRHVPYTYGAAEIERHEIDWLVEIDSPVVELVRAEPGQTELEIARHVAALVSDGATLQFGLGAVPEAIMGLLGDRHDLGIHSGLISDGVIDLVASGAITGARKATAPELIITTEAAGSRRFYDWLDHNERVVLAPAAYTHSLPILAQQTNFVGINSAVQVALDGTINAESLGARQISGPGGQPDFAAGAILNGGVSVVAMPSTAARGRVSRIVPQIDAESVITTPRTLADRIVTEYGEAALAGRTLDARADALRQIAHPDFRAAL